MNERTFSLKTVILVKITMVFGINRRTELSFEI